MSTTGYREEVLNVLRAQLLDEQGIVSAPEQSLKRAAQTRRVPDVLVLFRGLRTAIEGKVEDHSTASDDVHYFRGLYCPTFAGHIHFGHLYPLLN